jgi:arylsulfatase A-like enzyme
MLLSGTDAHIAGLGGMAQRLNSFPEIFKDSPGYEGYLNFGVAASPEIMQDNGYFINLVVWYGRQWASAATAPNRGAKPYTTEGGIRCPCIVRYPTETDLQPVSIANTFTMVMNILPKVLDLPGLNTLGNNFEAETPPRSKANRGKTSWSHLMRREPD